MHLHHKPLDYHYCDIDLKSILSMLILYDVIAPACRDLKVHLKK